MKHIPKVLQYVAYMCGCHKAHSSPVYLHGDTVCEHVVPEWEAVIDLHQETGGRTGCDILIYQCEHLGMNRIRINGLINQAIRERCLHSNAEFPLGVCATQSNNIYAGFN